MNRHERRRVERLAPKPTNIGRREKTVLILGDSEEGFSICPKEPPPDEFVELVHTHEERLRALLDRPVILAAHWEDGDSEAVVQVMPANHDADPQKAFEEFALPFPMQWSGRAQ
jgi:hypothetical protein